MNKILRKTALIFLLPFLACCNNSEVISSSTKSKTDREGCSSIIQDILDTTLTKPRYSQLTGEIIDNKGFNFDLIFQNNFKYKLWSYNNYRPYYYDISVGSSSFALYFEFDKSFDFYHIVNLYGNSYYFKLDNIFYFIKISSSGVYRQTSSASLYDQDFHTNSLFNNLNNMSYSPGDVNNSYFLRKYMEIYTDFDCSYKSNKKGNLEVQITYTKKNQNDVVLWDQIYTASYSDYICTKGKLKSTNYSDQSTTVRTSLNEFTKCDSFIREEDLINFVNLSDEELQTLEPTEGLFQELIGWEAE